VIHTTRGMSRQIISLMCTVVFIGLPRFVYARAEGPTQTFGVSYGRTLLPEHRSMALANYEFEWNKNIVSAEVGDTAFGNHPIGVGPVAGVPSSTNAFYKGTTSGARLVDLTVQYQREYYGRKRISMYAGAGGGVSFSTFKILAECSSLFCTLGNPQAGQFGATASAHAFGLGIGTGVRLLVWKGFGIRVGMEAWHIRGGSGTATSGPAGAEPLSTGSDVLSRLTIGLYYHH
jgi:hypothetical protein